MALPALFAGAALLWVRPRWRTGWRCVRHAQRKCPPSAGPMPAAFGVVLVAFFAVSLRCSGAMEDRVDEYRAKANFLAAFPNFIEWPAEAFQSQQTALLLCVFGDFSFGTTLAESTRGTLVHGRRIEVRWVRKEQDLRACQILFVSRSEAKRYGRVFKAVEGASVLTVGETPDFLASGGAIDFLIEEDRLQFEVNMGAATDAHLRISSNMLALARHVITKTESTKSSQGYGRKIWVALQTPNSNMEVRR